MLSCDDHEISFIASGPVISLSTLAELLKQHAFSANLPMTDQRMYVLNIFPS